MSKPIEAYALLGDTQTAALVATDGSIDWLCLPRFDSGACLAALVGTPDNGYWRIAPRGAVTKTTRRYLPGTLVLETTFETADGAVRLIDFMPVRTDVPKIVRIVRGVRGSVPMRFELRLRFDHGDVRPWLHRRDGRLNATAGPGAVVIDTPVRLHEDDPSADGTITCDFTVDEGDEVPFTLVWYASHESPPRPFSCTAALDATTKWWRHWSSINTHRGPWAEAIERSLIVLKALTYAPTGGIVAAATTSLPEQIGSVRNWDYRYSWLRDATFTLLSLMGAGYVDEARAWRDWLVRAVAGDPSKLQIMYGAAGERRLTEWEVPWLAGYEGSRPVRIGNAASGQYQLDVYGEVMDALFQAEIHGIPPDEQAWRIETAMLDFLEGHWNEPDEGIWEIRGPRREFTHSKVMAWVAVQRAAASIEHFGFDGPLDRWRRLADEIHRDVCEHGFDRGRNTFVQSYGAKELDASLLLIPLVGFLDPTDPRSVGTVEAVERDLCHTGFVHRYDSASDVDGLPPGEGVFLMCTFWLADNLVLQGRHDDARAIFERLLALRNDVGLLSEEYDPTHRRLLGNFPQAFSHVSLINTASRLEGRNSPAERRASHGTSKRS